MTTGMVDKLNEAEARQQAGLETTPKTKTLAELLNEMEPELRRAFPKTVDVGRFIRLAITETRTVPHLLECTAPSIQAGMMQAAQLGVEIGGLRGQAYLIPRKNGQTNRYEATFQLGYRGVIDIAGRSGVTVRLRAVHEADEFHYEDGLEPKLIHKPFLRGDRGAVYCYFGVATFPVERAPEFLVMTLGEIEAVRDRFGPRRGGKLFGPWVEHFEPMALKTLAIRLLNYLPLPVEVADAIHDDETAPIDVRNTAVERAELPPPGQDDAAGTTPPAGTSTQPDPAEGQERTPEQIAADLDRTLDGLNDAPPPED